VSRAGATDGATAAVAFARRLTTFGLFGAASGFATGTIAFVVGSTGFFDAAFFTDFFGDFLAGCLAAFFAAVFLAVLLAAFFVLPAFLATRLLWAARFLDAVFLLLRAGEDLRTFLAFFFLDVFLSAVATTNSFKSSSQIVGISDCRD
jgi:hypothetical protein